MKFSETWLREWVSPTLKSEELAAQLTMAGLEVESITPAAEKFSQVIVAQILKIEKHPQADRLQVCEVTIGNHPTLTIVCGGKNIYAGMKAPLAMIGAELPNNLKIKKSAIRGIESQGMLCSGNELGLVEADGIVDLPQDAPLGKDFREYYFLDDNVIDVSITPNRGDCLSIKGIAREVAALNQLTITSPQIKITAAKSTANFPIKIENFSACPRYVGRIIQNITTDKKSPLWLQERLRRGGIRSITPVVDVLNYAMLELGQPMHAFDLDQLNGAIHVRQSRAQESLLLLNGQEIILDAETLLIADDKNLLAIAGVMGGLPSSVTLNTKNIFLESAFFDAKSIVKTTRRYGLSSDSAYRFERGVDPTIQTLAIERATELLLEIVGGEPGPVFEVFDDTHLPKPLTITLRNDRIQKLLGITIAESETEASLSRLGFTLTKAAHDWQVQIPLHRSDVAIEEDLIEEIARLHGYDKIPTHAPTAMLQMLPRPEQKLLLTTLRQTLKDQSYQEVITYSFVDEKMQSLLLNSQGTEKTLMNPITTDMSVMRISLWPGLINTLRYNQNRQQNRIRLFESGLRFFQHENHLEQQNVLAGLASGTALPEQWGAKTRPLDFFDVKGDLENLFALTLTPQDFIFKSAMHTALHPGQTAEIFRGNECVGIVGALHPRLLQTLEIQAPVYLFELVLAPLQQASVPRMLPLSKFPEIRRDIAVIVNQTIPARQIQDTIRAASGEWLKTVTLFDVYQGQGIPEGQKSLALALLLQHPARTLVDDEVAEIIERVVTALKKNHAAELRG